MRFAAIFVAIVMTVGMSLVGITPAEAQAPVVQTSSQEDGDFFAKAILGGNARTAYAGNSPLWQSKVLGT